MELPIEDAEAAGGFRMLLQPAGPGVAGDLQFVTAGLCVADPLVEPPGLGTDRLVVGELRLGLSRAPYLGFPVPGPPVPPSASVFGVPVSTRRPVDPSKSSFGMQR